MISTLLFPHHLADFQMFRPVSSVLYDVQQIFLLWCVFVRASLHMRREEKPTRCRWKIYCTYNMLNMFRALLCPSSGGRDYMCVITAYDVQCLVAGCRGSGAGQKALRPGRGMLQHPYSWTHSLLLCTWPTTTSNKALHIIGGNNTI